MLYVVADFETRSAADLKRTGTYKYAQDKSTEILCLGWRYRGEERVRLWHPAFPNARPKRRRYFDADVLKYRVGIPPELGRFTDGIPEEGRDDLEELFEHVVRGDLVVEAHNAMFERAIWRYVGCKYGFPEMPDDAWRCTAAKAASFSLPRKLEDAARALGLDEQKSERGKYLIQRLCKPRKPTKIDPHSTWNEDVDLLFELFDYCGQDVRTEDALSTQLRELPPIELATWRLDQKMNARGVFVDRKFVEKALAVAEREVGRANEELRVVTGGLVDATSAVAQLLLWLHEQGAHLPDLTADTIDEALGRNAPWPLSRDARRALELRRLAAKASTKKYRSFLDSICADDRVRDLLMYWGANTGRWAGRRVQPQNFPRGNAKAIIGADDFKAWCKANGDPTSYLCREVLSYDPEMLRLLYGEQIMELLSTTLRGAICAPPGRDLCAADYAAIEACVTFWLAGQDDMLEVLRKSHRGEGPDIYRVMAGENIFNRDPNAIEKDSFERQVGKAAVLGLGFQMGASKFQGTCENAGVIIDEELAQRVVDAYRERCWRVVDLWKDLEQGAFEAVRRGSGGEAVTVGRMQWAVRGRFLHVKLASGRLLSYCDPTVVMAPTSWGDERPQLRFMGLGRNYQWDQQATYGGSLTENVVQATARDLMRDAMLRLDASGVYEPILTVHDEVLSEVNEGKGDIKEYEALVAQIPAWADGLPVAAEGWRGKRYRK